MNSYKRQISNNFMWGLMLLFSLISTSQAMDNATFLQQFKYNYEEQKFNAQLDLVKHNKAIIPGTVTDLIKEAMSDKYSFEERMQQLNIASAIAYMYLHWHKDDSLIKQVTPFIQAELKKEKKRVAEIMKWKKEERFLGNFVMKKHEKKMAKRGLSMVLYPHWLHRIMYECKVCHNSIFKMKRWDNNLSWQNIKKGEQCGVCHNGVEAFAATEASNCKLCHVAGSPNAEHLHHPEKIRQASIKAAVEGVGAQWRPENLPDGKLPLDRFQFIDWMKLKENNVFSPIASLDKNTVEETRDNKILFASKSGFVSDVIFDHKVHSDWIKCASCHPAIFKDELGGNRMKMTDMSKGLYCGHCHGKVSFTFADCLRCHKKTTGKLSMDKSRTTDALKRPVH